MRSPILYYGGKGRAIRWLAPLVPYCQTYVEPFAGGASLLFARQPSPVEVLNDLDGRLVCLYRVLQCPRKFARLRRRLEATLYSRSEFVRAIQTPHDAPELDRAWACFVGFNQGFAGRADTAGNWGYSVRTARKGMAGPVSKWLGRIDMLADFHGRLRRVQVECRPALEIIQTCDYPTTVFYCDPPYMPGTRVHGKYRHEMTDAQHGELLSVCLGLRGACCLSGYDHPLYDVLDANGWSRVQFDVSLSAGRGQKGRRTEVLWSNARAQELTAVSTAASRAASHGPGDSR